MLVQKVRRLTIRFRNPTQKRAAKGEIGVTAVIASGEGARAQETTAVTRPQRKRSTVLVQREANPSEADAARPSATPIERLVAEARERVILLSQTAGVGVAQTSVLARLAATGEISRRQYEAGLRYAEIVREHDMLLGRNVAGALADEAGQRTRYRRAMGQHDLCRTALREAGFEDRMASAVVDAVAVSNWDLPDLTPSLRIGLNHLVRAIDRFPSESGQLRDGGSSLRG